MEKKKRKPLRDGSKYIELRPTVKEEIELAELYYVQPDGTWKKNADGRSKGRTKRELIDMGLEHFIEEDLDEARQPLTLDQRRKRARVMKRYRRKILAAKERLKKRKASPEKLKQRARRKARNLIRQRLMRNKSYSEMTPSEKIQLDKRLLRIPDTVINRLAVRQLPVVRRAEMERIAALNSPKNESINEDFEHFLFERCECPTKRMHMMMTKEGRVKFDRRFKFFQKDAPLTESYMNDAYELMEEVESLYDEDDPSNREIGTDSLVRILRRRTPGQSRK